jgi:hypothetical protein
MSLEPHWYSTIYALYTLAGLGCAGLAGGILVLVHLRRSSPMRSYVTDEHLHDLGKLLLGFTVFWVYIWYCQYMLIWYTDLPEETSWYLARKAGTWGSLTAPNLILNWLVPFVVLLPRAAKRSEAVLVRVAWVVLVGHALDLYILAGPPLTPDCPRACTTTHSGRSRGSGIGFEFVANPAERRDRRRHAERSRRERHYLLNLVGADPHRDGLADSGVDGTLAERAHRDSQFHESRGLRVERAILAGLGDLFPRVAQAGVRADEFFVSARRLGDVCHRTSISRVRGCRTLFSRWMCR